VPRGEKSATSPRGAHSHWARGLWTVESGPFNPSQNCAASQFSRSPATTPKWCKPHASNSLQSFCQPNCADHFPFSVQFWSSFGLVSYRRAVNAPPALRLPPCTSRFALPLPCGTLQLSLSRRVVLRSGIGYGEQADDSSNIQLHGGADSRWPSKQKSVRLRARPSEKRDSAVIQLKENSK
jgi:hypothetical protein